MSNQHKFWLAAIVFLLIVTGVSGSIAWSRYRPAPPIEIILTPSATVPFTSVSVSGAATPAPQKIDLNRADRWLLEALPGIGETRAKAIIAYRQKNGDFRSTLELTSVEGISPSLYEQIKDLITVTD